MVSPYRQSQTVLPHDPPSDPENPHALQTWASQRTCPCCGVSMVAARQSGFRLEACGSCGGVWIGNADAKQMIESRGPLATELAQMASRNARGASSAAKVRQCPDCAHALSSKTVEAARSGVASLQWPSVHLDVCAAHGTWFDRGELVAVLTAYGVPTGLPIRPSTAPFDAEKVGAASKKGPLEEAASDLRGFLGDVIPATFVVLGKAAEALMKAEPHCYRHHHRCDD